MPNYRHEPQSVSDPIPDAAMDDFRSQRANLSILLSTYRATGIADPQLVKMGLVAAPKE